jgi:hypothetical protein
MSEGFQLLSNQKKAMLHLTPAPDFFIATCPNPGFSEKHSQDHQDLFETHLKRGDPK